MRTVRVGIAFLMDLMISPRGGENWGAAFGAMIFGGCGSIIGAIAGFTGAFRWIQQRTNEPWTVMTWIGVLLGSTLVLVIRVSGALEHQLIGDLIGWWPGLILFLAAGGTLGGFIGSIAGRLRKK